MPSSTPKQARTMAAAAHNPAFAKKVGIPQKVAKDFNQADKGGPMLRAKRPKKAAAKKAPPAFLQARRPAPKGPAPKSVAVPVRPPPRRAPMIAPQAQNMINSMGDMPY